jgi:transmembrane sensor
VKEEKYWVLLSKKLTGEATAAELEELREILHNHPDWAANMETLSEFWASKPLSNPAEHQKAEDAYLTHINRLKEKDPDFVTADNYDSLFTAKPKPLFKKWGFYAISGMAILTLFLWWYPFGQSNSQGAAAPNKLGANEISIGKGSRTKIQLPDGSMVWINSGSKLTYDGSFSAISREVTLEGEAYFDVVKDAAHPFIVHTAGIDIKVLGTAFNIKAYTVEPTIEATLIHGAIEVTNKNQPGTPKIMLKPHEKLVFNKVLAKVAGKKEAQPIAVGQEPEASPIIIKPLAKNITDTAIVETAWVYNKLIFDDERFEDLAVRMERWFNVKISIESDKLKNFKISGSFVNETAEEAVKVLQMLMPFNYSINKNEISIMRK